MDKINKHDIPHCIIISGFAGSGKSIIGKTLAKKIKYMYLDKDTISNGFTEQIIHNNNSYTGNRESDLYTYIIKPLEYESLINIAIENLQLGINVILSAPFISQLSDDNYVENNIAKYIKTNINSDIIWIDTNENTERIRLTDRASIRDVWKLENWNEYNKTIRILKPDFKDVIYFNNNDNTDSTFNKSIERLIKNLKG